MKINKNIPIDDRIANEKVRETHKNHDGDNKNNANKVDDCKDKISLFGKAKDIDELKRLIDDLPTIRSDRVDALKQAIDSGNYNIHTKQIAEKILKEYDIG